MIILLVSVVRGETHCTGWLLYSSNP